MQTNPALRRDLPAAVARYFSHEPREPRAVAEGFTEDAVVADEREEHRGRAAIAAWNAATVAKYGMTTEPLAVASEGAVTTVRARVSGDFPGSPIELRFRFCVEGDRIARLEIAP